MTYSQLFEDICSSIPIDLIIIPLQGLIHMFTIEKQKPKIFEHKSLRGKTECTLHRDLTSRVIYWTVTESDAPIEKIRTLPLRRFSTTIFF